MESSTTTLAAAGRPFIKRPRLTRVLDEAQARVIMLVAPAGYGKTTLAHEWLDGRAAPSAWYTCIPASSDVAALAAGIAEAAASVVPGAAERLRTRLTVTNAPESEVDVLADILAEDLTEWPDKAWLCIDDYHFTRRSEAAERFIERLLAQTPLCLLIATRERPTWATPRRILYGEFVEMGTTALAMTGEEVDEVLASRAASRLPGLLALTEGWPVAIGLAALRPDLELPQDGLPTALYEYIADELYQSAEPQLQLQLRQLALVPNLHRELLEPLFRDDVRAVLENGARLGFLTRAGGEITLHPLLRAFLEAKVRERGEAAASETSDVVAQLLADHGHWDDAFLIASRYRRGAILVSVIERSFEELLAAGRLATLVDWLSSPALSGDHPVLDLVRSELAFREARYAEAEGLARDAADRLPSASLLRGKALCSAGRAAYFRDRHQVAISAFREARASVSDVNVRRTAVRGELHAAAETDEGDLHQLVEELASLSDQPEQRLAVHTTRMHLALIRGNACDAVAGGEEEVHLLDKSQDPLVHSSFLNMMAAASTACGRYEDALRYAGLVLAEAARYRLTFVRPQALAIKAAVELGLREFGACRHTLRKLEADAAAHDDIRSMMNAAATRLRVDIAHHAYRSGLQASRRAWHRRPPPTAYGEYLALQSLALACAGDGREAAQHAQRAESSTSHHETGVLVACTRAIIAVGRHAPDRQSVLRQLSLLVKETGYFDSLVTAYRGFPPLLAEIFPLMEEDLSLRLHEARDANLARSVGIDIGPPSPSRSRSPLSRREAEVYALLRQGLTNREISASLFISESTVKVHVRNVLRKLNVRSRTEAALLEGPD